MIAKFFTIEEANKLIPELKRTLKNLKKRKEESGYIEYEVALIKLANKCKISFENEKDLQLKKKKLNNVIAELNGVIKRVHDLGCFLQDVNQGAVDFLSEKDGRPIFLCWMPGDNEISYYHEIDTGYNERKYLWYE